MDRNHIIIIILAIIIIALIALIGGFFFNSNPEEEIIIYNNTIDDVGTFNTTNVTNFTFSDASNDYQTDYLANDSRSQIAIMSSTSRMDTTISESVRVNDSSEGHTIYKATANIGEHKGEVRYLSFLTDNDKERYIMITSPDYNLTCMMVDSFKIF